MNPTIYISIKSSFAKSIIELESSKSDYTGLIERNELKSEEPEFRTKDAEIPYLQRQSCLFRNTHRIDGINPKEIPKKKIRMHFPASKNRTIWFLKNNLNKKKQNV